MKRKRTVATESGEPRKKRVRTNYTKEHLQQLEAVFAQTQYPDLLMREQIAEQFEVTEQKIHVSRQHCWVAIIVSCPDYFSARGQK